MYASYSPVSDSNISITPIKVEPVTPEHFEKGLTSTDFVLKYVDLKDKDILVITSKVVSILEGRAIDVRKVKPSLKSRKIGKAFNLSPSTVELIRSEGKIKFIFPFSSLMKNKKFSDFAYLQLADLTDEKDKEEVEALIKGAYGNILCTKKFGFLADSAGIDSSNLPKNYLALLPKKPGDSAKEIVRSIKEKTGKNIAVIITDTLGGVTGMSGCWDIPIGYYGFDPLERQGATRDLHGEMSTGGKTNYVMPLAAIAGVAMGNCDECTPIAIIKGFNYQPQPKGQDLSTCEDLMIDKETKRLLIVRTTFATIYYHLINLKAKVLSIFIKD